MAVCVGCGLEVDANGVLNVDLNGAGNTSGINCDNTNGLSLAIQHIDTTCISLDGNGTSASQLRADINLADANSALACDGSGLRVVLSGDACNGVRFQGGGLYAPCPDTTYCIMAAGTSGGVFTPFGINSGGAGNFNVHAGCTPAACNGCIGDRWIVTNTSPCCTMVGNLEVIAYIGGFLGPSIGFDAEGHLEISYNGGPFTGAFPVTSYRMQNFAGNHTFYDLANHEERNFLVLGPGASVDFAARASVNVFAGTATWQNGPQFEYYLHLTQSDCGCAG